MIQYYPPSKIIENQSTVGNDYTLDGNPYVGKYYLTFDGKAFTGQNPIIGDNKQLTPIAQYTKSPVLTSSKLPAVLATELARRTPDEKEVRINPTTPPAANEPGGPTSYYPYPLEQDYDKGYIIRYFAKKKNNSGYIIEISEIEYNSIQKGTAPYNISMYIVGKIFWKLTGPLNSIRISQYDTRAGIIDTNKRLVEDLDKKMIGMVEFIGGNYSKYSRPS